MIGNNIFSKKGSKLKTQHMNIKNLQTVVAKPTIDRLAASFRALHFASVHLDDGEVGLNAKKLFLAASFVRMMLSALFTIGFIELLV